MIISYFAGKTFFSILKEMAMFLLENWKPVLFCVLMIGWAVTYSALRIERSVNVTKQSRIDRYELRFKAIDKLRREQAVAHNHAMTAAEKEAELNLVESIKEADYAAGRIAEAGTVAEGLAILAEAMNEDIEVAR